MTISLQVTINYSQLILYLPSVDRPGHLWGEPEMQQGFAWSPGIVSFGIPEHAFICTVDIAVTEAFTMSPEAISCLRVPFDVSEAPVQVGSVFAYDAVDIAPGRYSLICEILPGHGTWSIESDGETETGDIDYVIKLWFVGDDTGSFDILKAGGAVQADRVLSRLTMLA